MPRHNIGEEVANVLAIDPMYSAVGCYLVLVREPSGMDVAYHIDTNETQVTVRDDYGNVLIRQDRFIDTIANVRHTYSAEDN